MLRRLPVDDIRFRPGVARTSARRSRPRAALLMAAAIGLAACEPAAPPAELPALPDVRTEDMVPVVAAQIGKARSDVLGSPTSAKKAGKLGMVHRAYNHFEAAEVAFRRARILSPSEPDWMYYHAEVLEELGRYEEALSEVTHFLEREEGDRSGLLLAASIQLALGMNDAAAGTLDSLLDDPPLAEAYLMKATILERQGRLEEAAAMLARCLELGGPFGQGYYQMAMLQRRLGNDEESDRYLALSRVHADARLRPYFGRMERVLRLNASDKPLLNRARAMKAAGKDRAVIDLLERAITINPDRMNTRTGLVLAYTAAEEYGAAETHLRIAEEQQPESAEVAYARGRLEFARGETASATLAFRRAVERSPEDAEARAWLGYALTRRGAVDEAGEQLARAVATDPANRFARFHYGRWLMRQDEPETAIREFRSMTTEDRVDTPILLAMLADVLAQQGQIDPAIGALDRGIELAELYGQAEIESRLRTQRGRTLALSSAGEAP